MEDLFKNTDLEIRYSINLNAISSKLEPKVFSLKDSLISFLNHRYNVLKRRSKFRLTKAQNRIEILKGFLIVFSHLNQVIKIIRSSDNPEKELMKIFKINQRQAEAILAMRLRQLKKLEERQIKEEHKELLSIKKELELILRSKIKQTSILESEFKESLDIFHNMNGFANRRTQINNDYKTVEYKIDQFESKDPITVLISKNGWIKSIRGHQENYENIKYKDGDSKKFIIPCRNNDRLLLFSSLGKFYTINCAKINTGRGFGDPLSLMIDKSDNEEIIFVNFYDSTKKYLITSSSGKGFFVSAEDLMASTKSGKKVMNLKDNDRAVSCSEKHGNSIAIFSGEKKSIKLLIIDHSDIPQMQKGRGVTLQKFKNGKTFKSICLNLDEGIIDKSNKTLLKSKELKKWLGKRAQAGKIEPKNLHLKI